jgi:arylsulfatase A-like enzyme
MHDVRGVVIASGPAFRKGIRIEDATILDIAPTVLAVMGHPVAEDMDGRPLLEIITNEHLDAHPALSVPTYEPSGRPAPQEIGSAMDESIKEKLKALGYIQ